MTNLQSIVDRNLLTVSRPFKGNAAHVTSPYVQKTSLSRLRMWLNICKPSYIFLKKNYCLLNKSTFLSKHLSAFQQVLSSRLILNLLQVIAKLGCSTSSICEQVEGRFFKWAWSCNSVDGFSFAIIQIVIITSKMVLNTVATLLLLASFSHFYYGS